MKKLSLTCAAAALLAATAPAAVITSYSIHYTKLYDAGIFLQRLIAFFRVGGIGGAALANVVDRLVQFLRGHATGVP